jgi:hypothetical protein
MDGNLEDIIMQLLLLASVVYYFVGSLHLSYLQNYPPLPLLCKL